MEFTPSGNEVLDFDPRRLPASHLAAIGLMSAAASSTDSIIEMAIAGMLGIDGEQGYAVTAHMSSPLRSSVLKAAAEIVLDDAEALNELDAILEAINATMPLRNDFVHGSWAVRPSDKTVLLVKQSARTHVDISSRAVGVDEIKAKAITLYEAGMALMQFLMDVDKVPKLPRDRQRGVNTPKARKAAKTRERRYGTSTKKL